ncbi:MAG: M14 family metallopeptidase [Armatimonadota bacterium]
MSDRESLKELLGVASYRDDVPSPEQVLGRPVGDAITSYDEMVLYIRALASASPRACVQTYGCTHEKRDLLCIVVSSPENLARAEDVRRDLAKLADPAMVRSSAEAEEIIRWCPAVVWLAHNVHGSELSTMEAALLTAFHFTASEDEKDSEVLDKVVIVIDPVQNPDGKERARLFQAIAVGRSPNPDENAAEHHEPWPGGRGNHYYFDLNRDWFALTQPESRAKVAWFLRWRPQVFADLHEMGHNSTYYFLPPAPPVNANFPEITHKWWEAYGRAMAAAFDAAGIDYYVRETFDAFYPGYGESWPSFQGATGLTLEQASAMGLCVKRRDDALLTLRDGALHHTLANVTLCRTTAARKEERLKDYYLFHVRAVESGRSGEVRAYALEPGPWEPDARRVLERLALQGIRSDVAVKEFVADGAPVAEPERWERRTFPAGTYVLRLGQPAGHLLKAIFEAEPSIDKEYLQEEIERNKSRLPSRFYDATAWSLPLAFGLPFQQISEVDRDVLRPVSDVVRGDSNGLPRARYGYLVRYETSAAACVLGTLLREGIKVWVAMRPFSVGGKRYRRGTIVVKRSGNPEALHEVLARAAQEAGVEVASADSAWTDEGPGLGGESVVLVKPPKIAVLYGEPTGATAYGWAAYLLDQVYGIPFTPIRRQVLQSGDIRPYTAILLPDGSPDEYQRMLGDTAKRLREWVSAGGVLVTIGGASEFIARKEHEFTTCRVVTDLRRIQEEQEEKRAEPGRETEKPKEEVPAEHKPERVPGAILRVQLDKHSFLTLGYGGSACVLVDSARVFTKSKAGHNVAVYAPQERLKVAGFVWEKMLNALPGTVYLADERIGAGRLVLFSEDPTFRACWEGLHRMWLNALVFGPSVDA